MLKLGPWKSWNTATPWIFKIHTVAKISMVGTKQCNKQIRLDHLWYLCTTNQARISMVVTKQVQQTKCSPVFKAKVHEFGNTCWWCPAGKYSSKFMCTWFDFLIKCQSVLETVMFYWKSCGPCLFRTNPQWWRMVWTWWTLL